MPRANTQSLQTYFGAALRVLRRKQDRSLESLAEELGMKPAQLADLEDGGEGPPGLQVQQLLGRLGQALGVNLTQMAEQADRCRLAAKLRELAEVLEFAPGTASALQNQQVLMVRAWIFGDVEAFAQLVKLLRGVWMEPVR